MTASKVLSLTPLRQGPPPPKIKTILVSKRLWISLKTWILHNLKCRIHISLTLSKLMPHLKNPQQGQVQLRIREGLWHRKTWDSTWIGCNKQGFRKVAQSQEITLFIDRNQSWKLQLRRLLRRSIHNWYPNRESWWVVAIGLSLSKSLLM